MRAIIVNKEKKRAELVERPVPEPGPGEVRVRIRCAALNHRDLWILQGQYPGIRDGVILGSDGAGTVDACGEGVYSQWLNKPVVINPSLNWGENPHHQSDQYQILGNPRDGTFAEYLVIPIENVYEKPEHLSWEEAAALPLAGLTAYRALFIRGGLHPGESVLITGIGGGVALLALQMAVQVGARVWVTSSQTQKIQRAIQMGAEGGFLYTDPQWVQTARKQMGMIDLVIDGASGPSVAAYCELVKPGGRIVIYGQTAGKIQDFSTARLFYRQQAILGSTMGSPHDFERMLTFWSKTKMRPIVDSVYAVTDYEQAFARMQSGEQFGKIVLGF